MSMLGVLINEPYTAVPESLFPHLWINQEYCLYTRMETKWFYEKKSLGVVSGPFEVEIFREFEWAFVQETASMWFWS